MMNGFPISQNKHIWTSVPEPQYPIELRPVCGLTEQRFPSFSARKQAPVLLGLDSTNTDNPVPSYSDALSLW